jgi:aryl-alcohol dehydrogenase-like predicted oxidoreductase
MKLRKLGNSSLMVTPICLGGNVFGWTINEKTSFDVLDAFVAGGGNFIDTADVYSAWAGTPGISEEIIGRWMKARSNRAKLVIASKCGSDMPGGKGLGRKWIFQAVEDSLRRLQTDCIDLHQSHRDDTETPQEETLRAYDDLIRQGKLRAIGNSNFSGARTQESVDISAKHQLARYESSQPKYNLVDREEFETDLAPVLIKNNIGCIPYYALAAGFLTGKYRNGQPLPDSKRASGVSQRYMNDKGFAVIEQLERAAKQLNASMSQVAVAWLMHAPAITAPIASATSVAQVNEMLGAAALDAKAVQAALA